jgi:hypothetical protein
MESLESLLKDYPRCPICEGSDREASPFPNEEVGFYVTQFLSFLAVEPETVLPRLKLGRCRDCGTLWYDPWFAPSVIASAYTYVTGRHKLGWATLRAWLEGLDRNYVQVQPNILALLRDVTSGLSTYAEVNCPFAGVFTPILQDLRPKDGRKLVSDRVRLLSMMYANPTFKTGYSQAGDLRRTVIGKLEDTSRYLIEEPSEICWNRSCTFSGANCVSVAKDTLVDRVATFEQLSAAGTVIDAIGFFNTFDHFLDPIQVLEKALRVGRYVFLDLHAYKWIDSQHHFNIGDRIVEHLKSRDIDARDVTDLIREQGKLGDPRRYILCRSNHHTENA